MGFSMRDTFRTLKGHLTTKSQRTFIRGLRFRTRAQPSEGQAATYTSQPTTQDSPNAIEEARPAPPLSGVEDDIEAPAVQSEGGYDSNVR
jgi:hypothetical protein